MPPVFPSGQIPPGACVQVRPVGATLPTAARRAPSREAADGYTCPPAPDGSPTGKHVTPGPQSPATGTGRSDTCVDMWRGKAENFRKPIEESHDFRPSWQARSGTHSW